MFIRPPAVRTRNPGRRPMQPRLPINELNRPLLRQFVRNRRSDPRYEAYILEGREGPAVNGNTNAAASKSIPQPWVTVRDFVQSNNSIGLPVSVCDTLLKHLLSCVATEESVVTDSSEENEPICASPTPSAEPPQASSPAEASGDAKSAMDEATSEENSSKKSPQRAHTKPFQIGQLNPIRIVCEATGCMLEVTGRDPTVKRPATTVGESDQPVIPVDASRRWIVSAPLETRPNQNGEQMGEGNSTASAAAAANKRRNPWETRGILELHESLMAQLSAFLADVVTRYRSVNQLPEVRSLYSASGGRRFFFDLRDTRWGKRLHISQVTDLHRNVIGIPLEALCTFRARLDMVIQSLGLEDQHVLRSELYGPPPEGMSSRDQREHLTATPQDRSQEAGDGSVDGGGNGTPGGGRKGTPNMTNRGDAGPGLRRGRERRRQRIRSFTGNNTGGGGGYGGGGGGYGGGGGQVTPSQTSRAMEATSDHTTDNASRRIGSNNGPGPNGTQGGGAGMMGAGRRFARRNRNPRLFNRSRRPPTTEDGQGDAEESEAAPVPDGPEPAIDAGRVAPVAEASA